MKCISKGFIVKTGMQDSVILETWTWKTSVGTTSVWGCLGDHWYRMILSIFLGGTLGPWMQVVVLGDFLRPVGRIDLVVVRRSPSGNPWMRRSPYVVNTDWNTYSYLEAAKCVEISDCEQSILRMIRSKAEHFAIHPPYKKTLIAVRSETVEKGNKI